MTQIHKRDLYRERKTLQGLAYTGHISRRLYWNVDRHIHPLYSWLRAIDARRGK